MIRRSHQILILFMLTVLAACSPGSGQKTVYPLSNAVSDSKNSTQKSTSPTDVNEKAEALLDEGESLLSPEDVSKSQDKFHAALALSPENTRAKFWVSMADFFAEIKGSIRRVHPFYQSIEGGEERYNGWTAGYRATLGSPMSRFLFTGPEDIRTSTEFAELFDRIRLRISNVRKTLAEIRESEITITIPEAFASGPIHDRSCPGVAFGPIKFQPSETLCATSVIGQVGLNTSDFDQLGTGFSAFQVYLEFLTAYQVNQNALFAQLGKPISTKKEAKSFVTKLFKGGDGHLVHPKAFVSLQEIGAQTLVALRFQLEHQATECPRGQFAPSNRKGYLYSSGNCVEISETADLRERNMQALEALAAGRPVVNSDGFSEIDYNELANHPPENIKTLFPIRFDSCANIIDAKTENLPKIFLFMNKQMVFGRAHCNRSEQ